MRVCDSFQAEQDEGDLEGPPAVIAVEIWWAGRISGREPVRPGTLHKHGLIGQPECLPCVAVRGEQGDTRAYSLKRLATPIQVTFGCDLECAGQVRHLL